MIGDWVKFPNSIEKIIDLPYIEGRGICASFAASATLFPVEVDELEPIPLTPEILEENANGGWCNYQSEPQRRSIYHIGEVAVYVEWERIVTSPYIELHGLGDTFFKGYIDYVHELQHALKLCGIEKEIML